MVTSRINFSSLVFISLFVIFNVNQGMSLQCYHCTSDSNGTCWTDPTKEHLMTCEEQTNTTASPPTATSTAASTATSSAASTVAPTAAPTAAPTTAPSSGENSATPTGQRKIRGRRSADQRADDSWECVKLTGKEGDKETVTRKCAKKNDSFCNGKTENTCFTCSDKDGCNSASSIGFQLISMVLPLATALFLAR